MSTTIYTGQKFNGPSETIVVGKPVENNLREVKYPERESGRQRQIRSESVLKDVIDREGWEEIEGFKWVDRTVRCPFCKQFMVTSTYEGEPSADCDNCEEFLTQDQLIEMGKVEENYSGGSR
jgi:hypothetical protein